MNVLLSTPFNFVCPTLPLLKAYPLLYFEKNGHPTNMEFLCVYLHCTRKVMEVYVAEIWLRLAC
jgi:hypothetical protein